MLSQAASGAPDLEDTRPDLHPMSLGDLFDSAFDLYKTNFALFMSVVAVLGVPLQLATGALTISIDFDKFAGSNSSPSEVTAVFEAAGLLLLAAFLTQFIWVIQAGAVSISVADRLLGRPSTVGSCYRAVRGSALRLAITWLLVDCLLIACVFVIGFVVIMMIGLVGMALSAVAPAASEVVGVIIGVTAVVIPTVLVFGAIAAFALFVPQVVALEGPAFTASIQRNWDLVRRRFWRVAAGAFLLFLIYVALDMALISTVQFGLDLPLFSWLHLSVLEHKIVTDLWGILVQLFLTPYVFVFLTLFYLDLRARNEGLDLLLRQQVLFSAPYAESRT